MTGAVQHVVLFQFPRELTPEEEAAAVAQIRSWPSLIGGFTRLRFGRDRSQGARTRGFQYLLFAEFADQEKLRAYFPHPVHQRFSDWVAERGCVTLAFDYDLDGQTSIVDS
jgi:hypothetical protein